MKKRKTIDIPDEQFNKIKLAAFLSNKTTKEFIEEIILNACKQLNNPNNFVNQCNKM